MAEDHQPEERNPIGVFVREAESAWTSGQGVQASKYVKIDLYEDINTIEAYLNSKHISGQYDALGREKPFMNIVVTARNARYRATDIDRANINLAPAFIRQTASAFMMTCLLQQWMKKEDYGSFLNKWGMALSEYNDVVVKHVEKDGKLIAMVVPWTRLIVDQIDFENNPKIEILELTEAQLYERGYDSEQVKALCDARQTRRDASNSTQKDQKDDYVRLYEVHGMFPLSYKTHMESDERNYQQMVFVLAFEEKSDKKGEFDDYILYSGRETQDPYELTSLLPTTDGSITLNGTVKQLFEGQWMRNHTVKSIKDQLDIASKLMFQTADANFIGRNVLQSIESGDIFIHKENMPLTQVNNTSHDITIQQTFAQMWRGNDNELVGISDSVLGNTAPSGTAWRQVEALLAESHSLFELMTENKALALERMLRKFVIPFLKKKMDTPDEITAILSDANISKLDAMYVPREAVRRYNKRSIAQIEKAVDDPSAELPQPFDRGIEEASVRESLSQLGNQRFLIPSETTKQTWKSALEDLEWTLDINITPENKNLSIMATTLSTALTTIMNPMYSQNPQAQLVVSKILNLTGAISPIELSTAPAPKMLPNPVVGGPGGLPAQTQ